MKTLEKIEKKTNEIFLETKKTNTANSFRLGACWLLEKENRKSEQEYINFFLEEKTEENLYYYNIGKKWFQGINNPCSV